MKTRSNILSKAMLFVLTAALTLVICFPVVAASSSTTLTTTVPRTDPLLLELEGNGAVTINGVNYTQSGTIKVPHNSSIELLITPDTGNNIKTVTYNGHDYTTEAKNGKFTLPAATAEATLYIRFSATALTPETGDPHYFTLLYYIALMVVSLISMIAMPILRKKNTY